MKNILLLAMLGTLLTACGQKGALYLPKNTNQAPAGTVANTSSNTNPNDY